MVKKNRPVNLDLLSIQLPLSAYVSILHRISGVILFLSIPFFLYVLDLSLGSEEEFLVISTFFEGGLVSFVVWGMLSALLYHFIAGIKHLFMDVGIAEEKESGKRASMLVIFLSLLLMTALGVWIW